MYLTDRDKNLFKFLAEMALMTTSQIRQAVFKNIATTTILRRLRVLESAGYIQKLEGLKSNERGWYLTLRGAEVVGIFRCKRNFNRSTLDHDVRLVDLRLSLENHGVAHSWVPEHEIRSKMAIKYGLRSMKSQVVPDGIMGVSYHGANESVAIELEFNYKNKGRYREIFKTYMWKEKIHAVWYLVPTINVGIYLCNLWVEYVGRDSRVMFLFSQIDDVVKNGSQATVRHFEDSHKVNEVWALKVKDKPAQEAAQMVSSELSSKIENQNVVSDQNQKELLLKAV